MPAPEYLPVMRDVVCFVAVAICGRSGILSSCWGFGVAAMFRCSGIWSGFLWGVEVSYIASRPPGGRCARGTLTIHYWRDDPMHGCQIGSSCPVLHAK
jgi:hypothetical protein